MDPYEILQVKRDASEEEIKKQYKRLSSLYHPDRPSGSARLQSEVNIAYEILTNPEKKELFDKLGFIPNESLDQEARGSVFKFIDDHLLEKDPLLDNAIRALRAHLHEAEGELLSKKAATAAAIRVLEAKQCRMGFKGEGEDVLLSFIQEHTQKRRALLIGIGRSIDLINAARRFLDQYEVAPPPPPPPSVVHPNSRLAGLMGRANRTPWNQ